MWRERALKIVLAVVGLLFTAAICPLILMAREALRVVLEDPNKREVQIEWHFDENLPKDSRFV